MVRCCTGLFTVLYCIVLYCTGVPDNVVVDGHAGGAGLPAAALPRRADQVILDQIRAPQHEDEQVKDHQ